MTETVNQEVEETEVEENMEVKSVLPYEGPDKNAAHFINILQQRAEQYKVVAAEIENSDKAYEVAVQEFLDSDNNEVMKLRKAINQANERLQKMAGVYADENAVTLSEEVLAKKNEELETRKKKFRKARTATLDSAEVNEIDYEGVKVAVEAVGDPTKSTGGKSANAGTGLPRVSLNITMTHPKNDPLSPDTFSQAKMHLEAHGVSFKDKGVAELQAAYAEAAGVDPGDIKEVKRPVEFDFGEYHFLCTPKERAKYGSQKK